ncbi:MAG TPA: ATP-binding protein [Planctomycetota bacterium]|nr:ATP-binding protein [Planctomycetota bacterium]
MGASESKPDLAAALKLFDETTAALGARLERMDQILGQKQQELVATNRALSDKVAELDRLSGWSNLVMGAVASGVLAVDRAGIITTCNAAAEACLRPVILDPIGASYAEAFPDSPLLRVAVGEIESAAYERAIGGPGGRRILSAKASALRAPDGQAIGAVEVFEDVTEVRRLRETVERADRLQQLGEMAAGVAHEIRNPLNGIEGFASLLARDLPEGDKRRRYADLVVDGVRALNRTVSGLLEFTKPRRIAPTAVAPRDLAQACIDLVASELAHQAGDGDTGHAGAAAPAAQLAIDDRWDGGRVPLDGQQLKQVLLNLVQNAVHAATTVHGDGGARVTLRLARGVDGSGRPALLIQVDDNGPGVPAEERQRIFTPFYTTKDHGTGLGLAVSHTIAGLHGGTLSVDDAPGGGARFVLVLPID